MATPPTFVASYATVFDTLTSPKTVSVTVAAGDTLVVIAASEDSAQTLTTPTGGGLTYTPQQSVVVANFATVYIWTVDPVPSSQTFTLSGSNTNGNGVGRFGYCAVRFSGSGGIGASTKTNVTSGAPSLGVGTSDNSAVVSVSSDWTATDGTTRTWRTINGSTPTAGNGLELVYALSAGAYTAYGAYWPDTGAAGTSTVGLTAPGAQKYSIAGVEVLGVSGGGGGATDPGRGYPVLPPHLLYELVAAKQSVSAPVSGPKTYYVATAGSDSNDGLTPGTAWQTIAKVNSTTLNPGDTVLFNGGDTFSGQVAPTTSGTATAPIVYNSYGTGNATISNTTADAFAFVSHGGFEVRNLTITGGATSFSNGSAGVDAYSPAGSGKFSHILVDSCDISGFQHGVIVGGDTTSEGFDQITITNNTCHGNKNDGIALWGGAGGTAFSNSNATITGNVCNNNLGDSADTNPTGSGIVVGSTSTCLIDQCVAHDNGGSNNAAGGPVGIWCYDSTAVTIQRCLSYSNKTAGSTDGGGFDLDINVSNSTLQYCLAYGNDGPGYMFFASATAVFTGNTVRYNLSYANVRNTSLAPTTYGEMLIGGTVASSAVYGNTFYAKDNASNNISALVINATPTGVTVRNNIFQSQTAATVQAGSAWTTGQAFMQGNDYYRASGTSIKWGATTYTSLATWRAAVTGQEQVSAVNVGNTVDPVFVSPTTTPTATTVAAMTSYTGLQLSGSTPLAAAGLDLNGTFGINPGTRDFWNNTLTVPLSVGANEVDSVAGGSSVTGAGALSATATQGAVASPAGTGALTASVVQQATASLTGAGSLSAAVTQRATAAPAGTGSLSSPVVQQAVSVPAGAGVLASAAVQSATAALTGAGSLSASSAGTASGTASIAGAGALSASATQGTTSALAGTGSVTAPANQGASAAPTGAGTLSGTAVQQATAQPAGAGVLSSPAVQQATASLAGAGALSAAGGIPGGGSAALAGAGTLSAAATQQATALLTGLGAATVLATQNGKASLAGTGALAGAGVIAGAATLAAAGSLSSLAVQGGGASLAGAGALSASAGGLTSGTAGLVGAGVLTISLNPCITSRPSTGTTGRPGSGTTARPDTGITQDPC